MKFIDLNDGHLYTIADLENDWRELRSEDPESYAGSFKIEFLEILMATVNGRNDLEVIGMTNHEVSNYIVKLRSEIQQKECWN